MLQVYVMFEGSIQRFGGQTSEIFGDLGIIVGAGEEGWILEIGLGGLLWRGSNIINFIKYRGVA